MITLLAIGSALAAVASSEASPPDDVHVQTLGDHLRIWTDSNRILGWDELQAIKDEYLGPDVTAIEVYPPADEVVNEACIRHLWATELPVPSLKRRGR